MPDVAYGIDIGGSSIKAGLVDLGTGAVRGRLSSVTTPTPSTPMAIASEAARLLERFGVPDTVPVGVCLPAPVVSGLVPFMANLDQTWVGVDVPVFLRGRLGRPVAVLNDADAAALGEVAFGAARGVRGTVVVTTLGTGIGSGVVVDGRLVPNVELGHLEIDGYDAESRASARQKALEHLSWPQWAARLQRYYSHLESLFSPELFVVGGAVSQHADAFLPLLDLRVPIVPAQLRNRAGVIGSAAFAVVRRGSDGLPGSGSLR